MNAHYYLQEQHGYRHRYISMSALAYLYVGHTCAYTHIQANTYSDIPTVLAYKTVGLATHTDGHIQYFLSLRYVFLNWFPPSQIHLCFLRLFFKPTNSPEFSHFDTRKQINTEWLSSSGSNLLSFAKLEIFDLACQRGKKEKRTTRKKQTCFLKAEETVFKKKRCEQIISDDDSRSHFSLSCKKIIFLISGLSTFPALLASLSLSFTPLPISFLHYFPCSFSLQ